MGSDFNAAGSRISKSFKSHGSTGSSLFSSLFLCHAFARILKFARRLRPRYTRISIHCEKMSLYKTLLKTIDFSACVVMYALCCGCSAKLLTARSISPCVKWPPRGSSWMQGFSQISAVFFSPLIVTSPSNPSPKTMSLNVGSIAAAMRCTVGTEVSLRHGGVY